MRLLALTRFRLVAAAGSTAVLAPLATLLAVQLVVFAGGRTGAAVAEVTSVSLAFPVLAWLARQVLDAVPDDQVRLDRLAVGGRYRERASALLAAWLVTAVCAVLCLVVADRHLDGGLPWTVSLAGAALAAATAAAATGVGALAARDASGGGAVPVVVLVLVPVLTAALGTVGDGAGRVVGVLVPRFVPALAAADHGWLVAQAPVLVAQVALWGLVVAGVAVALGRRR